MMPQGRLHALPEGYWLPGQQWEHPEVRISGRLAVRFMSQALCLRVSLPFMRELQPGAYSRPVVLILCAFRNGTNYMFRAVVVNPRETFTDVDSPLKFWRIESQFADGTMVDLNRVIPSFPILSRLSASQVACTKRITASFRRFVIFQWTFLL